MSPSAIVALVMVAANEGDLPARAIESARGVCDFAVVLDTGTGPMEYGDTMPVDVVAGEFRDFGQARTDALAAARDRADWLLMLDADDVIVHDDGLRDWLPEATDDVFAVRFTERTVSYRIPRLVRGGMDWRYVGATHEHLDWPDAGRPLTGFVVEHLHDGANRAAKHERDIELLADGVRIGDPRSVYYTAQAFRGLGRVEDAAAMYAARASMNGWEEERWHAAYLAASLRGDVDQLLAVHRQRPHRHEPLSAAARILRSRTHPDVLFLED